MAQQEALPSGETVTVDKSTYQARRRRATAGTSGGGTLVCACTIPSVVVFQFQLRRRLVCLDVRAYRARDSISRRARHTWWSRERGLVCLDVRAYRARDSISRRAKGAPATRRQTCLSGRGRGRRHGRGLGIPCAIESHWVGRKRGRDREMVTW